MKNKFMSIVIKLIIAIIVIIVLVFGIYVFTNAKTGDKSEEKTDKIEAEINYLDTKIINLINQINGIKLQNYKVTMSKVEEEKAENMGGGDKEEEESQQDENQEEENSKEETKITKMEQIRVGDENTKTNWEFIQSETEILFSVWGTMVLDLYDIGIQSENVVGFSDTLDQTLISVKNKNKAEAAINFAKLYNYVQIFAKASKIDDLKKNVIETKSYIINSYAYAETENFEKIESEVRKSRGKIFRNFKQCKQRQRPKKIQHKQNIYTNRRTKKFIIKKRQTIILCKIQIPNRRTKYSHLNLKPHLSFIKVEKSCTAPKENVSFEIKNAFSFDTYK